MSLMICEEIIIMAEEVDEAGEGEEGEKKKKPLLLIIIAVVVLLAGGGGAFFMLGGSEDAEAIAEGSEDATATGTESESESESEEETVSKEAIYFSLDPAFVVNFQGKGRVRFLQVNIDGLTREAGIKEEVTKHLPQIRNNIVLLLSSKTYEDLSTPEGKGKVRSEILVEIQKIMESETGKTAVENIFFTSFVIQ